MVEIDRCLRHTNLSASKLGRLAANDPRLIPDLRRGRQLGPRLTAQLLAVMKELRK